MPKKRTSQPMQVWLPDADRQRLAVVAEKTGQTKSQLAREAIQLLLDQMEDRVRARAALAERGLSFENYSPACRRTIGRAEEEAWRFGFNQIRSEHLLLALCRDEIVGDLLEKSGITYASARNKTLVFIGMGNDSVLDTTSFAHDAEQCLRRAKRIGAECHDKLIDSVDLLLSVLQQHKGGAYDVLEVIGIDRELVSSQALKVKPESNVKRKSRRTPKER